VIAEVLRQIAHAKATNADLRTQLNDVRTAAAQSHATIQADLEAQRARKRTEDAARAELKAEMKAAEDAKRMADTARREAEKRLRLAESKREDATARVGRLEEEINQLEAQMREDEAAVVRERDEGERVEREAKEELEAKRKEIKVAEDVVAALSVRAKELEEKIAQEEERLSKAKDEAELRKQDRSFYPLHVVSVVEEDDAAPWSPITTYSQGHAQDQHPEINTDVTKSTEIFPQIVQAPLSRVVEPVAPKERQGLSLSPRPKNLSLGGISNFRDHLHSSITDNPNDAFLRPQGFGFYDDKLPAPLSSTRSHTTRFSPFSELDAEFPGGGLVGGEAISPRSTSLIPSSLITSLEGGMSMEDVSRSFQSENDDVMDPNWRALRPQPAPGEYSNAFNTSPTSITNPSFDGIDQDDPFEIRPPPLVMRRRLTTERVTLQRPAVPVPSRTISDPQSIPQIKSQDADAEDKTINAAHRRWHSADPKDKKGLNPEAKVFRLTTKTSLPSFVPPQTKPPYDSLGPVSKSTVPSTRSVPSVMPSLTSDSELFSSLSMRAFAPSPAEREALQRALGSSSNASLERLPTLSEVSLASMPPSPSHVHAIATQRPPVNGEAGSRTLLPPGLSWLQPSKKTTFSPWEDEVPQGFGQNGR